MREQILLAKVATHLQQEASSLRGSAFLSLDERARIERLLFLAAKELARRAGHEIHTLSTVAVVELQGFSAGGVVPKWHRRALQRAVELNATLSRVASSDAYVADEIAAEFDRGRVEAVQILLAAIEKYAGHLLSMDSEPVEER